MCVLTRKRIFYENNISKILRPLFGSLCEVACLKRTYKSNFNFLCVLHAAKMNAKTGNVVVTSDTKNLSSLFGLWSYTRSCSI